MRGMRFKGDRTIGGSREGGTLKNLPIVYSQQRKLASVLMNAVNAPR